MTVAHWQTAAQIFVGGFLNTAVEGIVLAGLVWVLLRVVGQQNSSTRFAVWFSALFAIAGLPFLSGNVFRAGHPSTLPLAVRGGITLPTSWASYLFAAWGVIAGLLLLRLVAGLWRVRAIRGNCSPADLAAAEPELAAILQKFESHRPVTVCVSDEMAMPAAIGFFRPAVVFPARLLPQLSAEEVRVILLHELAHLRRWDDWSNLAMGVVKAVFFFHPAVWWIENRLTLEREMACDDLVLAATANPRKYASCLISFAEKLQNPRGLALAQALVSRMCHMSLRVAQILDAQRPKQTRLWKPVLGLSAGVLAVGLAAVPYAPPLVAFRNLAKESPTQSVRASNDEAKAESVQRAIYPTGAMLGRQVLSQAPHATVIPAAFSMRTTGSARRLKPTFGRASLAKAKTKKVRFANPEMFVILQTTQYDASGSPVWTLCIWRVQGGQRAERQLESAVANSI
jgi:Zn-dependent protease with chaperone function